MQITKIYFEELFPTGAYANQRLGIEVMLSPGDNELKAFALAKGSIEQAFRHINPPQQTLYTSPPVPTINREAERVEILIENASCPSALEFQRESAEKWGLMEQFKNKMEELKK